MDSGIEIVGAIGNIQTIASGAGIRELANLRKLFGDGKWRKLKGEATVMMPSGNRRLCEVHWYEAHGIGKRKIKIKRFLD
ncbi:MAG TPA: hypothetical protein VIE67_06610 [Rudaea sp.]|jgi:hypothetical protein|uniref:hypothetical protein n=1 Tax=Rudaea sp. TaxID=2136325 RepID=UPI002F930F53